MTSTLPGMELPAGSAPDQAQFNEAVKENVEVLAGQRGDPRARALTVDELEKTGLISVAVKGGFAYISAGAALSRAAGTRVTGGSSFGGDIAVTLELSKTAVALISYADGTVPSFEAATGIAKVYYGRLDVTEAAVLSYEATNCTGTVNEVANAPTAGEPKGYYEVTALSADWGELKIRASYNGQSIDRTFVVTRVTAGFEIVGSLPTTNLFEGRVVYLESDGKLYKYTGSAWVPLVPETSGIPSVGELPETGAEGDVVFLTTDGKLYRYHDGEWTKAVEADDIVGIIAADHFDDFPTERLDGQIIGTQIADDSISTPKIQANAITATKIAAGAISTDKLLVMVPGAALNADPNFADPTAWQFVSGLPANFVTVTDGKVGTTALRSTTTHGWYRGAQVIPLDPAKTYRISAWARRNSTATGLLLIGAMLFDSSGGLISIDGSNGLWVTAYFATPSTSWTRYTGTIGPGGIAAPSNTRTMCPAFLINYNGSAGYVEIQDCRIEEVIPGTLIQDGAITTAKIQAGAVTANEIAANTITANQIAAGTITAAKIAGGTITGNEIAGNTITGVKIQAGTLTAAHLATNTITAASGVIASAAITSAMIADGSIVNAKIGNLEVDNAKIANLTIGTTKVANNAITQTLSAGASSGPPLPTGGNPTVTSLTVACTGGPLVISWWCEINHSVNANPSGVSAYLFGSSGIIDLIQDSGLANWMGPVIRGHTNTVVLNPGAGTFTYEVRASAPFGTGWSIGRNGIVISELKK